MRLLRKLKVSPALLIACVALLVSAAGPGIAAVAQLGKGTVGTPQLKNNAVTSAKVKNGSLLRADFKDGQGPAGPRGPVGEAGPAGAPGPVGPSTAFHARFAFADNGTPMTTQNVVILHTLNLPAGSYAAVGTTTVRNLGTGPETASCELVPSTGASMKYVASVAADPQFTELSGTIAFTLSSPGTVRLQCMRDGFGGLPIPMTRNASTLTAVKVGEAVQP